MIPRGGRYLLHFRQKKPGRTTDDSYERSDRKRTDVMGNNEISAGTCTTCGLDSTEWVSKHDKPLIMSEFGGDAQFGNHGDAQTRFTEEYQETLYEHQIATLKRITFLRGTTPWIGGFPKPAPRTLPGIEDYFNRKRLLTPITAKRRRPSLYCSSGISKRPRTLRVCVTARRRSPQRLKPD